MALLEILEFPDPRLRTRAELVAEVDGEVRAIVRDMLNTMYHASGIGLAATQVNIHRRIIVIDVSEDRDELLVFINPEIVVIDEEPESHDEGCLSVPGFYESVVRPRKVRVSALDQHGESFAIEPIGMLAVCIQHEIDHLDGVLFIDYLTPLKRNIILRKMKKLKRLQD